MMGEKEARLKSIGLPMPVDSTTGIRCTCQGLGFRYHEEECAVSVAYYLSGFDLRWSNTSWAREQESHCD